MEWIFVMYSNIQFCHIIMIRFTVYYTSFVYLFFLYVSIMFFLYFYDNYNNFGNFKDNKNALFFSMKKLKIRLNQLFLQYFQCKEFQ